MSLEIYHHRIYEERDFTVGLIRVGRGGKVFTVLEDGFREPKVPGETRIPAGSYRLALRRNSNMAARYLRKFGHTHKGMIWLQDVPGFEYVYYHVGNDEGDTEGCPLIGTTMDPMAGFVGRSTDAYKTFFSLVIPRIDAGEQVEVSICEQFI